MRQFLHADEEEERTRRVLLEACGRALVVLARSIEEQLELGYALSAPEIVEIREFAVELMAEAAEILAAPLALESQSGGVDRVDRHRQSVRLRRALERILDTSASATDFSASLQSGADLIRSTRKEEDHARRVDHAMRKAML